MWGYTLGVLDRDDAHHCRAGMSQKLALTVVIAVAAAVVGAMLAVAGRPAPEGVTSGPAIARRAEDAPGGARASPPGALKPPTGRVLRVTPAVSELDLIPPARAKVA